MKRLIVGSGEPGESEHLLNKEIMLIGRGQDCEIRIDCQEISRFHARLEQQPDGALVVMDLDSSNGTFVNNERISTPTAINTGDSLRFGNTPASLECDGHEDLNSHREHRVRSWLLAACATLLMLAGLSWFVPWAALFPETEDEAERAQTPHEVSSPPPAAQPSDPVKEAEPLPDAAETETIRPPDPIPSDPPTARRKPVRKQRIALADGSVVEAVIKNRTAAWLHLADKLEGSQSRIALELVRSVDGNAIIFDAKAAFAERRSHASDETALMGLTNWARDHGLTEEVQVVARQILSMFPNHPGARALLGEYLYGGTWKQAADLASLGALGPDGSLEGTDADLLQIRRWCFALLGRPPLPEEVSSFLGGRRRELRQQLMDAPEAWYWWCFSETQHLLEPGDLPLAEKMLQEVAAGLEEGSHTYLELFQAIPPILLEEPPGREPRRIVARIFRGLLGVEPGSDRQLMEAATRMWKGERVAVFGERGTSAEDLVSILCRQPAFYRKRLEVLGTMLFGKPPAPRETMRQAFMIAGNPSSFSDLRRKWSQEALRVDAVGPHREKTDAQLINGLYLDALGRKPRPLERGEGLRLLRSLGDRDIAQGLIAHAILSLRTPAEPDATSPEWSVRSAFRRSCARTPDPSEIAEGVRLLERRNTGMNGLLRVVLSSQEYRWF